MRYLPNQSLVDRNWSCSPLVTYAIERNLLNCIEEVEELTYRHNVDYAMFVKQCGSPGVKEQRRYPPATITGINTKAVCGNLDASRIAPRTSSKAIFQ